MYKLVPIPENPLFEGKALFSSSSKSSVTLSLSDYNTLFNCATKLEAIHKCLEETLSDQYYYPDSADREIASILNFSIEEIPTTDNT